MLRRKFVRKFSLTWYLLVMPLTAQSGLPIFDSHLHYGGEDVINFSPAQIIDIFDDNNIAYALVSSTPNDGTEKLYRKAPQRIIPFLGLYQTLEDKRDWMWDESVVPRVKEALTNGIYRGIGELHIFAKDRKSPVLREVVSIASSKDLMLQVHGDAEILDEIFQIAPNVTVLWAHMGTRRPEADYLRQVLERHPQHLYIDTSVRDRQLLGSHGQLSSEWRQLFIDYQDRFMVGVDTFSVNRWKTFTEVTQQIHQWLSQLPEAVAHKLAYDNAYRLFFPEETRVEVQAVE